MISHLWRCHQDIEGKMLTAVALLRRFPPVRLRIMHTSGFSVCSTPKFLGNLRCWEQLFRISELPGRSRTYVTSCLLQRRHLVKQPLHQLIESIHPVLEKIKGFGETNWIAICKWSRWPSGSLR